jgi:hypothetical protein
MLWYFLYLCFSLLDLGFSFLRCCPLQRGAGELPVFSAPFRAFFRLQPRSLFISSQSVYAPGKERQLSIMQRDFPNMGGSHISHRHIGHTHFWERAMLSRRQFVATAAGATGAILASGLWMPGTALADNAAPKPIPEGIQPFGPGTEVFHVFPIAHGVEPSTITDFHGSIAAAEIQGTGTATNSGSTSSLNFDADMRFMQGVYIGVDGEKHSGTFGFI